MTRSYNSSSSTVKLTAPPDDTVSDLCFSQQKNLLAASSWDGTVRIWEFNEQYSNSQYPFIHRETGKDAVLRVVFKPDPETFYIGTTKGEIKSISSSTKQASVIGKQDGPITGLKWCNNHNLLISAAMDGNICTWDVNSGKPTGMTASQPQTQFSIGIPIVNIDVGGSIIYFAGNGSAIGKIDLRQPANILSCNSQLTNISQVTSIAAIPDGSGYIAGSVSGHVEINCDMNKRELFRCHRAEQSGSIYASNAVAVSPVSPAAISVGSDGMGYCFNYQNLKGGKDLRLSNNGTFPLTSVAFVPNQPIIAVAQGYDWSKGAEHYNTGTYFSPEVHLRRMNSSDFG